MTAFYPSVILYVYKPKAVFQQENCLFVLYNKNPLYNSLITHFPSKLETVTGKIECTKKQYEKFGEDMLRAVDGKADRIIVHN